MLIDVLNRMKSRWENVEFFLEKFPSFFVGIDTDTVFEEFVDYQTLWDEDIDQEAWKEAKVIDKTNGGDDEVFHYRADVLWWYTANMKVPGSQLKRFKNLFLVAEIILVLPHSNAEEERLFSIVRKNRCDSRFPLQIEGSLPFFLLFLCAFFWLSRDDDNPHRVN